MSAEDRAKATAKNVEGKVQQAAGEISGNPDDKAEGKAKEGEANVRHTVENAKDKIKDALN
ncbi:CsbD family protein [Phormidium tenue FACHB-886]|nr:CsbD family protein [Phormidium tenue FACHB-886]